MNDLSNILTHTNTMITNYADDTNLLVSSKVFPDIIADSNMLFLKARDWFIKNGFLLNVEKTNVMLFRTKQLQIEPPKKIKIVDDSIDLKNDIKFLGVQIDANLDWSVQVNVVCQKLNKICYSMRVISKYLNETSMRNIYFANFESVARFGIIFWGSNKDINNVFIIQKRVIRLMYDMKYTESCKGIFKSKNICTIIAIYIYECLLFMFKNKQSLFNHNTVHKYDTRTVDINYPIHRLTLTERNPHYMCIRLYNNLPDNFKCIESLGEFKKKLKRYLVNLEPYTLSEYLVNRN